MASDKKPFWKKALRTFAYAAGAVLIAAGVIAAIGASHGAAAPFVHVVWAGIAHTPWIAATAASGAMALGLTGIAAYFASKSGRGQERKRARKMEKAMQLCAQAGRPDFAHSYGQGLEQQMGHAPLIYSVAPPAYSMAQPAYSLAPPLKPSLAKYLSSYPTPPAADRQKAASHHKSERVSAPYMGLSY